MREEPLWWDQWASTRGAAELALVATTVPFPAT